MAAGLEWLGLVVLVGFVDKLDVEEEAMAVDCSQSLVEEAMAVDCSQSLVEVEGVVSNVVHCHLADDDDKCNLHDHHVVVFVVQPTETYDSFTPQADL